MTVGKGTQIVVDMDYTVSYYYINSHAYKLSVQRPSLNVDLFTRLGEFIWPAKAAPFHMDKGEIVYDIPVPIVKTHPKFKEVKYNEEIDGVYYKYDLLSAEEGYYKLVPVYSDNKDVIEEDSILKHCFVKYNEIHEQNPAILACKAKLGQSISGNHFQGTVERIIIKDITKNKIKHCEKILCNVHGADYHEVDIYTYPKGKSIDFMQYTVLYSITTIDGYEAWIPANLCNYPQEKDIYDV